MKLEGIFTPGGRGVIATFSKNERGYTLRRGPR